MRDWPKAGIARMRFKVSELRALKSIHEEAVLNSGSLLGPLPDSIEVGPALIAKVNLQVTDSDILVSGEIDGTLACTCARCLEIANAPLHVVFKQVFGMDQDEIDLDNDMRESVLLDLPVNALCREDCAGLCATCGANKNLSKCRCAQAGGDKRWDALARIKLD
jgi:uncharacterized protein